MDMRGLSHFIRDIRQTADDKHQEATRVQEELAKIRAKFLNEGQMTLYDRKKYVCKLMFVHMLGYPVSFGHLEGIKLMSEETSSEKLIGYLSVTVLLNENSPMMTLTTHAVYRDLLSGVDLDKGLALTAIANIGNRSFVEVMQRGVQDIVLREAHNPDILKRSVLTLLSVVRKYPEIVDVRLTIEKISEHIESTQESLVIACVTFMLETINEENMHWFDGVSESLVRVLSRIINDKKTDPGCIYYGVPSPWLQCKVLALLQRFPNPTESQKGAVGDIIRKILRGTEKTLAEAQTQQKQRGTTNRVNAMIAVLYEVVQLVVAWRLDARYANECLVLIGRFVTTKRGSNMRLVGLALLAKLSRVQVPDFDFFSAAKQFEQNIIVALHDRDISLRLVALDVLVVMCRPDNASDIVKELITYLPLNVDPVFRRRVVAAIATLSEKFFDTGSSEYIDVMLGAVSEAGDICSPDVTESITRIVASNSQVQKRAARSAFKALSKKGLKNEVVLRLSAFLLGEYGAQIALNPESSPAAQVDLMRHHLAFSTEITQSVLLHGLLKMYNVYTKLELREKIIKTFRSYTNSTSVVLQQASTEYLYLLEHANSALINSLLESLPPIPLKDAAEARAKRVAGLYSETSNNANNVALPDLLQQLSSSAGKEQEEDGGCDVEQAFYFEISEEDIGKARGENAKNAALFHRCLLHNDSMLYEDDYVAVHCTQKYRLADCRLHLRVTEKMEKHLKWAQRPDLAVVGVDAGLLLEHRPASLNAATSSSLLEEEVAARSAYPYASPPTVQLTYGVDGGNTPVRVCKILSLPILTTRFVAPYNVTSTPAEEIIAEITRRSSAFKTKIGAPAANTSLEALRAALTRMRYTVVQDGSDGAVLYGLGVHLTSPSSTIVSRELLVALRHAGHGPDGEDEVSVTVYAPHHTDSTTLQEAVASSLYQHICSF